MFSSIGLKCVLLGRFEDCLNSLNITVSFHIKHVLFGMLGTSNSINILID